MSTTTTNPRAGAPERKPSATAKNPLVVFLKALASLRLTVVLFAFSVGLVFLGTLAQKGVGIWTVVDQYFWSWAVLVDTQHILEFGKIFFELPTDLQAKSWAKIPFPGGKLLGGLLLINLLAAHALRFRLTWKRSGIFLLHGGILVLFCGEFITREFQIEQQMHIPEGGSANFAIDTRNYELAITDSAAADADKVVTISAKQMRKAQRDKQRITHAELPVDVEVLQYMANSGFADPRSAPTNPATHGAGTARVVVEEPEVSGVDTSNRMDIPSAYVRFFKKGSDEELGTYLVSLLVGRPQQLKGVGEKTTIELRNTRYYKPFTMHLIDFKFDRYVGTDKPKNYSSDLRLVDPEKGQDRELTIKMNDPLRHRGETFYQSSFTPDEKSTILQVVRNPGWWLPYVSCGMVTLGMLVHFGISIIGFLFRLLPFLKQTRTQLAERAAKPLAAPEAIANLPIWLLVVIPGIAMGLVLMYVTAASMVGTSDGKIDLREAARIPVVDGGRVKPLDTFVRVDMRLISHREEFQDGKVTRPAIKWFLDVASNDPDARSEAAMYRVFRIEHDQVRDLLKLELREGLRYSIKEMAPRYREFLEAVEKAEARPQKDRDLYEAKLLELNRNIQIYLAIGHQRTPMMLPPGEGQEWRSPADLAEKIVLTQFNAMGGPGGQGFQSLGQMRAQIAMIEDPQRREALNTTLDRMILQATEDARETDAAFGAWDGVLTAYRTGDQKKFDAALTEFRKHAEAGVSESDRARVRFEVFLNESGLFYHCTVLYALAIVFGLATWVGLIVHPTLGRAMRWGVFWWLVAVFAVHTFTLISRMYLMDRPLVFVTNLHSSAIFIGWVAIALCLIVELLYPIGIGNTVGALLGFATSIIAHNLATSGDTLEMMEAVLDTNFWLATHVTTVTAGYGATYIAGVVGLLYVALYLLPPEMALKKSVTLGRWPTARTLELGRALGQIIYGVVCFATLLSFVGTVLGGIWADQSWGRFWGWDPKENGAVLIVIWNALILHARWCGLVKDRGMAVLSLVGIMITTWSWFGTNQLGVGLHAYGFSNKLAFGCAVTWVLCMVPIVAGMIPWPQIWKATKG